MASIPEQIATLKQSINSVKTLVDGTRQAGALYPTLGNIVTFGCKVAASSSTTITFQDDDHINPDKQSPVIAGRVETYPNIGIIYGETFALYNTTATIDEVPSATYSRYDIVYAYVGSGGSAIAIATGTATTGTPADPSIPAGSMSIARLTVDSSGITGINDLRNFSTRVDYGSPAFTGTPTAPTATVGTNTTQLATTAFVQQNVKNKNLIINGDFSVWQRGESATITSNGFVYNSADRWRFYNADTAITKTYQIYNGTRRDAVQIAHTGSEKAYITHYIEKGASKISGKTVTVSFLGAVTSGQTGVRVTLGLTNDAGALIWSSLQSLTLTGSTAKYSATFTVDDESASAITDGNAYLQIDTATTTGASTLLLSDVQVEIGETATEFEEVPYQTQLARCQRYGTSLAFTDVSGLSRPYLTGMKNSTNVMSCVITTPVPLYKAPSIQGTAATFRVFDASGTGTVITGTVASIGNIKTVNNQLMFTVPLLADLGDYHPHIWNFVEPCSLFFDAEIY